VFPGRSSKQLKAANFFLGRFNGLPLREDISNDRFEEAVSNNDQRWGVRALA
jgi:hypothetical protein